MDEDSLKRFLGFYQHEAKVKNRALVPTPWGQVGLTVLPGLVLLFIYPFSLPLVSETLIFLGSVALLVMIVSTVVQVIAHRTLLQAPVWALIPLGLLTALGSMATIGSLGFYPTFFLLILLGLVLARQNGLSAGLFVLAGAMIAASWAIEQATYVDIRPYAAVLLHADVITAVVVLPPILVLRARSILNQIVALLFPVVAYSALFAFPQSFIIWMNIPAIECLLFAPAVASASKRWSARPWIYAAVVTLLAFLLLPTALLAEPQWPVQLPEAVEQLLLLGIFFMPPAALIIAALLLYAGLTIFQGWRNTRQREDENSQAQRKHAGRMAAAALILSVLLLAVTLYNLYWLMVWDSTTDSLDYFWLGLPVRAALFAGIVLALALPRWTKLAGLIYALLLPALIIAVSTNAKSVDYRRLTQERAGQVSEAIEAYYAREGRYPENLQQLTPFYMLMLPGPVIMYGQGWCYQGGKDYYWFGYLDREHWSSLIRFGRLYSFKGHSPLKVDVCQTVIDTFRMQHPDYDRALQQYGIPTPTPDIRE